MTDLKTRLAARFLAIAMTAACQPPPTGVLKIEPPGTFTAPCPRPAEPPRPNVTSKALPTTILTDGARIVVARWAVTNTSTRSIEILRMSLAFDFDGVEPSDFRLWNGSMQYPDADYALSRCQSRNCLVDINFVQEIIAPGETRVYDFSVDLTWFPSDACAGTMVTQLVGGNSFLWSDGPGDTGAVHSGRKVDGFDNGRVTSQTLSR